MTRKEWWIDDDSEPPNFLNPGANVGYESENPMAALIGGFIGLVIAIGIIAFVLSLLDFSPTIHDVRYEVSSNCESVDVFYENEWGGSSSKQVDTSGDKKWTYSYETEFDGFTFMYVSGQANCGQDEVRVLTALYIDDNPVDYEMCEGGYCIATASDMR